MKRFSTLLTAWLVIGGLVSLTGPIFWAFAVLASTIIGAFVAVVSFASLFTDDP